MGGKEFNSNCTWRAVGGVLGKRLKKCIGQSDIVIWKLMKGTNEGKQLEEKMEHGDGVLKNGRGSLGKRKKICM